MRRAASYLRESLAEYMEDSATEIDAAAQTEPPYYRTIIVRAHLLRTTTTSIHHG